jgi:uncharacterized protein (TIGR02145 family)
MNHLHIKNLAALFLIPVTFFVGCKKESKPASVITSQASNITTSSATIGGVIYDDGGSEISEKGIVFNTNPYPTTANNSILVGGGYSNFSGNITGLLGNTKYYARAFAINEAGTSYGELIEFTTSAQGTVTDASGVTYTTVVIGEQEWMAENLRTTKFANGDAIPIGQDAPNNTPAWCNYENNVSNDITYGKLYNWYTVVDSRNVCPNGWHVPSDDEWTVLTNYLMKTSTGWTNPNTGTNESGFSGLPGGRCYFFDFTSDDYFDLGGYGYWWSSTESSLSDAWYRRLSYSSSGVGRDENEVDEGLSVRCIRD